MACPTLSALKNIHAKTVIAKVIIICRKSLTDGNNLPFATMSIFDRWVLKIMDGIINNAFNPPQTMKVQFAPCQKPLTKKMINVFLIFAHIPPLLPPNGM